MAKPTADTPSGTKVEYLGQECILVWGNDIGKNGFPKFSFPYVKTILDHIFLLGYSNPTGYDPYWMIPSNDCEVIETPQTKYVASNTCPKCSSSKLEWWSGQHKCGDCWWTW